jgi:resuscitation-promoting factor RpfB
VGGIVAATAAAAAGGPLPGRQVMAAAADNQTVHIGHIGHLGAAHPQPGDRIALSAKDSSARTPRRIARRMLSSFGWRQSQFKYLNWLWDRESSWNVYATNPASGAYGIPQAVPAAKMASAGPDWQSNARTQIRWGLEYISGTYGTPELAWDHELATGWY